MPPAQISFDVANALKRVLVCLSAYNRTCKHQGGFEGTGPLLSDQAALGTRTTVERSLCVIISDTAHSED